MAKIKDIYNEFKYKKVTFHRKIETDIFEDALESFLNKKYSTSANLCATLYEMIFTTRLVRETANPEGFIPSKNNLVKQLENLNNKENDIINVKKLSFRSITKELKDKGILSEKEKDEFDSFYTEIRNPVLHGLTFRLFEKLIGRKPTNLFEVDINYSLVYEKAAEELINKIHYLMTVKVLRKM